MKKLFGILLVTIFLFSVQNLSAQIKLDVPKKLEKETNKRLNKKTDQAIDRTFDKMEKDIDESVSKTAEKDSENSTKNESESKSETKKDQKTDVQKSESKSDVLSAEKPQEVNTVFSWAKYDFIPGTEIIFEDDFRGETNGEFPSRWDITKGTVEMAQFGEDMVVYFRKTNSNGPDAILPYLKNRTEDYLPDEFTVEFDCYFYGKKSENNTYYLFFYDAKNQMKIMSPSKPIRVVYNSVTYDHVGDKYPGQDELKPIAGWRHVAISFNKRVIKGYLDDTRLVNIPNIEFNPTGIMLTAANVGGVNKPFIKNVRIAKGAVPLYDKFLVDGKFVTTGIKFDVNKATIKAESMGTINYVVKMMTDHPELKFSVEGHTDSDGEDASNQKLSEARAKAVLETMVKLGITADRLTSKGHGESKPMVGNDSPEGKAQNRRVEFVKF
jgi:outer membrane protein OmpA-like peptidoglycan-associated protein